MAKFDLNDSSVVVIVGSGAGGGTLGNELAQKGVKVVILEAGPRIENQDFGVLFAAMGNCDEQFAPLGSEEGGAWRAGKRPAESQSESSAEDLHRLGGEG